MLEPKPTINALVVDDSAFMRNAIRSMLESDESIRVMATGRNGMDAIKLTQQFQPDILTLDIEMPEMDGLTACRQIKRLCPDTRILMVSSLTTEGSHVTLQALRYGADDFIAKDQSQISLDIKHIRDDLLAKVHALVESKRSGRPISKPAIAHDHHVDVKQLLNKKPPRAILIGSSTGGPPVLEKLITALPERFPYPVLIAQHMPATFTASLVERMNDMANVPVVHVDRHMPMENGKVYLAQGGKHLRVRKAIGTSAIQLEAATEPADALYKPCVDELFSSAAKVFGANVLSIVLTGMGCDGLEGGRLLHEVGAPIIAQDHESCVVYGMPKAVTQAGLIVASMNPDQIAQLLSQAQSRTWAA
ncbi:MAG: chemotaxis response regulator protein-glutamate methylesterase [Phycisphaeraceae bacterium]|nr:chemotaxis response regulator protein-glutamate methylesterase [Phycisphaeraceae bacterium]